MIDHQMDRHLRVDLPGVTTERPDAVAHRGKIDDCGHAGKILHQHPRRAILNLRVRARFLLPVDHRRTARPLWPGNNRHSSCPRHQGWSGWKAYPCRLRSCETTSLDLLFVFFCSYFSVRLGPAPEGRIAQPHNDRQTAVNRMPGTLAERRVRGKRKW